MRQKKQIEELFNQLDEIYKKTNYNGAYGIVSSNQILHKKTIGLSCFEKKKEFKTTTQTCLASVTKQFTAMALLILASENKINLNAMLAEYFPEYIHATEITLLDMIHMASGIPSLHLTIYEENLARLLEQGMSEEEAHFTASLELDEANITIESLIDWLNEKNLDFQPGSQFAYSNENYALLGEIIARVTGKSYGNYLNERIFEPLGMSDTSTTTEDSKAVSYRLVDDERRRFETGRLSSADGGMVSTLEDMMKWIQGILNQALLSAVDWERVFILRNNQYGFGWMKLGDWYYHGGEYLGFYSEIFIHREAKIGKIMLYNLEASKELDQLSMDERSIWREKFVAAIIPSDK